jgi:large subunit ribosomal protein L24
MVVCPNCDKPTRIGHARLDDQHKTRVRVCKHCGEQLEVGK